jgi:hypothetical protein
MSTTGATGAALNASRTRSRPGLVEVTVKLAHQLRSRGAGQHKPDVQLAFAAGVSAAGRRATVHPSGSLVGRRATGLPNPSSGRIGWTAMASMLGKVIADLRGFD